MAFGAKAIDRLWSRVVSGKLSRPPGLRGLLLLDGSRLPGPIFHLVPVRHSTPPSFPIRELLACNRQRIFRKRQSKW